MSHATALQFQNTAFDIIDRNGTPWLRGLQVASALGYKNPSADITNLYDRNADEFTDQMNALVELDTNGGKQQVRVFSLRGCHLLGMLSKTKIAKEFRVWVLDILEKFTQPAIQQPAIDINNPIVLRNLLLNHVEKVIELETKIEADKPKVDFAMAVRNTKGTCSVEDFAKSLGIGRNNCFKAMRQLKILMRNNAPYQQYMDAGWFKRPETGIYKDSKGNEHPTFSTVITGKGQVALEKKLRGFKGGVK